MMAVAADKLHRLVRGQGEHAGIVVLHKFPAGGVRFADHYLLGMFQQRTGQGADSRGARPQQQHRVLRGDLGDLHRPKAGSQQIPGEQSLPVRNPLWNPGQALIRKGHPDVFRLSPIDAAAQGPAAAGIGSDIH